MDVSLVIRYRLNELSLEQRDLANAAQVTKSHIYQLLTGEKTPSVARRTTVQSAIWAHW
jgi:transcriptional regulator with XRE-family HTH domain